MITNKLTDKDSADKLVCGIDNHTAYEKPSSSNVSDEVMMKESSPTMNDDNDNDVEEEESPTTTKNAMTKQRKPKRKDLSEFEKTEIMNFLLINYQDGKLKKATIRNAAEKFNLHRNTVGTIWRSAKKKLAEGSTAFDVSSKKKRNGRKRKNWDAEIENIKNIPGSEKLSLRTLSKASNIPRTTLHNLIKQKKIQKISKKTKSLAHSYLRINSSTNTIIENDSKHVSSNPAMKELFESIQKLDSNQILEVQEFVNSRYLINSNTASI